MTARRPSVRLAVGAAGAGALVAALAVLLSPSSETPSPSATPAPSGLTAPVAAGTSAANVPLDGAGKRVLVRWVARSTGTLEALHLRIQANGSDCRRNGQTGYGLGNGGSWRVTTHPVLPDGRPDAGTTLSSYGFRPCEAPPAVVDVRQGTVRVPMRLDVTRGREYATVVANGDRNAAANWTSTNFLFTSTGIVGANGRNERNPKAPDVYYGLDARELVGYSDDAGRTWSLPGGPYGSPGGRNFLPTYLEEYQGGAISGQPFYYAAAPTTRPRTVIYRGLGRPWTIRELGAYTPTSGEGTISLTVPGHPTVTVRVAGAGMLRAAIDPITVDAGRSVTVIEKGLTLQDVVADTAWGRLMGMHLATSPSHIDGEANFSRAAPVYALPRPPVPGPTTG